MSSVLRVQEFITELDSIKFVDIESYRKSVNRLCKRELDYLRQHVELTTLRRYRTDYRNAIREFYNGKSLPTVYLDKKNKGKPTHIAVKYFSLKRNETREYVAYENDRKNVYLDIFEGVRLEIVNHSEMIKVAIGLLDSDNPYEVAAGLLQLTGRRTIEIWKLGNFELIPNKQNLIIFSGQAKTRDSENAKNSYPIFTLCNSQLVVNALAKLRSMKDFTNHTEQQVNACTSGFLGQSVKRHFNQFINDYSGLITARDLRAIYVHIAQFLFAPNTVISNFATQVLGHVIKASADNYMLFRLKTD